MWKSFSNRYLPTPSVHLAVKEDVKFCKIGEIGRLSRANAVFKKVSAVVTGERDKLNGMQILRIWEWGIIHTSSFSPGHRP
jgi:hypothetical protein